MSEVTPDQDNEINDVNHETLEFLVSLLKRSNPMIVAGVMTAAAFGIYKSILRPEEYDMMIDSISSSRDQINSVSSILTSEKRTLH